MRLSRISAVALRDLRQRVAGKGWYRLPALALALLIPAGIFPGSGPPSESTVENRPAVVVSGNVPLDLRGKLRLDDTSPIGISGSNPVRVRAPFIPGELRGALDSLPGQPRIEVRRFRPDIRLPGRSILLALLAVSLLTGPLAEALPGERSRKTLEVLLSAGISRTELIVGKWSAWTLAACASAFMAAAMSAATSVQSPSWWLLGLPLFIGTAVALGLWLVRSVSDLVGGAAAPMRVLPVVSVGMALLAWIVSRSYPTLAAAVPLGGALLVAGDVLTGPAPLAAAAAGSAVSTSFLLAWTARDLDRWAGESAAERSGGGGLLAIAALGWWLAVGGPGVWAIAGNPGVHLSAVAATAGGGAFLLICALVAAAREGCLDLGWDKAGCGRILAASAGSGLLLSLLGTTNTALLLPAWSAPVIERMAAAALPSGFSLLVTVLVVAGHTMLFRNVLQRRISMIGAAAAWTLIVFPFDPIRGCISGLILGGLSKHSGTASAFLAHLIWALAAQSAVLNLS